MSESHSLFSGLDGAVADLLTATDYFAGPPAKPVVVQRDGNLMALMNAKLGALTPGGVIVTVFPPKPLSPPPSSDEEACELKVLIGEKFLLSRQSIGAERAESEESAGQARGVVLATLRGQEVAPWGLLTLAAEETDEATDGRTHTLTFTARLLVTITVP